MSPYKPSVITQRLCQCESCPNEHLVAFSCKRRGFCPSCGARRMAETAIHLVDEVLPIKPIRQWVLSFPIQIRLLLAFRPKIMTEILNIVTKTIAQHLCKRAGFKRAEVKTGTVTLIQRFGGSINLNIHFTATCEAVQLRMPLRPDY